MTSSRSVIPVPANGGAWVYRVLPSKVLAFGDAHGLTGYRF
jgi:hypothetical protein